MTDFIRFQIDGQNVNLEWKGLWPPPESSWYLYHAEYGHSYMFGADQPSEEFTLYRRDSYSKISDEDIKDMTHVARGALYVPHDQCPTMDCVLQQEHEGDHRLVWT